MAADSSSIPPYLFFEITPSLCIGDERAASNLELLTAHNIQNVINACASSSVDGISGAPNYFPSKFKYLSLPMLDIDTQPLQPHVNNAISFLKRNPAKKTLVHCAAGISRSSAIVCALLMRERSVDVDLALAAIRARHVGAHPNAGFRRQLEALQAEWIAEARRSEGETADREQEKRKHQNEEKHEEEESEAPSDAWFSCRQCRQKLYCGSEVIPHQAGSGQAAFHHKKRDRRAAAGPPQCTVQFIEQPAWLGDLTGLVGDRMLCPKCQARVGAWKWEGLQCSCG